jgi:hypothetical protein
VLDHHDGVAKRGRGRCLNKAHYAPAGWCPDCDAEWDHTRRITEAEMGEAFAAQEKLWREQLIAAKARLALFSDYHDRTPDVIIARVETRKVVRDLEEQLRGLAHQWRVGGEKFEKEKR